MGLEVPSPAHATARLSRDPTPHLPSQLIPLRRFLATRLAACRARLHKPSGVTSCAAPPEIDLSIHYPAHGGSDRFALAVTRFLRFFADTFFAKRYGHRAIVLETMAAMPGMVGATLTHLRCLRQMKSDRGWIRILMEEAENERMHLMIFLEVCKPTLFERLIVLIVQWFFYIFFFALYLISPKTAHRLVCESEALRRFIAVTLTTGAVPLTMPYGELAKRAEFVFADALRRASSDLGRRT